MKNPFAKRPWLLVIVAFILLISAWATLITLANKYRPESVPLEIPATADASP